MIKTTMVPKQVNVSYDQLLFGAIPAEEGNRDSGMGADGQESFEPAQAPGTGDATMGQRHFGHVPGPVKTALVGVREKYPSLQVVDLMAATLPPLRYLAIQIGPSGACLDMLCFGSCKEPRCTYKHPATRFNIEPAGASTAASKLKAGHGGWQGHGEWESMWPKLATMIFITIEKHAPNWTSTKLKACEPTCARSMFFYIEPSTVCRCSLFEIEGSTKSWRSSMTKKGTGPLAP
jgi:hypothetical protein